MAWIAFSLTERSEWESQCAHFTTYVHYSAERGRSGVKIWSTPMHGKLQEKVVQASILGQRQTWNQSRNFWTLRQIRNGSGVET